MTVLQLKKACKEHKYLLLRFTSGYQMAINTKCAKIALKRKEYLESEETDVVSFTPCDFQTYISKKHGFL